MRNLPSAYGPSSNLQNMRAVQGIDRRSLFTHFAAGTALLFVPRVAFGQDVVDAIQAAVEIAGMIGQFFKPNAGPDETQLIRINIKLDSIIRSQTTILSELAEIKIALGRLLENEDIHHLNALKDTYTPLISQPYSQRKADYDNLYDDLATTCGALGDDTFAAFTAYASGLMMLLTVAYRRGQSATDIANVKNTYASHLGTWLDASNPNSIAYLVSTTAKSIDVRRQELDSAPKSIDQGVTGNSSPTQRCSWHVHLNIGGDFQSGYTGSRSITDRQCEPVRFVPPGHIPITDVNNWAITADVNTADADVPKPLDTLTGFPEVDALNTKRNGVIADMILLGRYRALESAIQAAANALKQAS